MREIAGVDIRPMGPGDVDAAIAIFASAIGPLAEEAGPERSMLEQLAVDGATRFGARFRATLRFLCESDPEGVWIAEVDDTPAGFAVGVRRHEQWSLPMLFVDPEHQSRGVGRSLLTSALSSFGRCRRGIVMSSTDPRAIRAYARAGFRLHPTMKAVGGVASDRAPSSLGVRPGSELDIGAMDAVDRSVRRSSRTIDLEFLLDQGARVLVAEGRGRGYVVHFDGAPIMDGNPLMLVADGAGTAKRLLWAALAEVGPAVELYALSDAQWWAVEAAVEAGLELAPDGPLFTRGWGALPAGWIPSGIFF